jgi:membrane-associated phospholipid phosphatase
MLDSLINIDHYLFDFINQGLSNSFFDFVMPYARKKVTWIPFYLIGAILLFKFKGKQAVFIILGSALAVGMADGISSHLLKPFFERTRPCLLPEFANHVNLIIERCSGAFSFPSSHAANHFALASFLSLVLYNESKAWVFVLVLWASLICFAQVYVGVHFPSDVLAGAILGSVIGGLVTYFYRIIIRKKLLQLS